MPLPPAIGTCTVSGQFLLPSTGAPNNGLIIFQAPTELIDTADHAIVAPGTYTAVLDGTGSFSIALPYNDNPNVSPTGWSYLVTEDVVGGRSYYIQLPRSVGATVKLDSLAQAPVPSGPVFPNPWVPLAAIQAKGDMLTGAGTAQVVRTAIGADGRVWTADSTAPGGASWQVPANAPVTSVMGMTGAVTGLLLAANNLADLANAGTARTNLGLGGAAVVGVPISIANGGTGQTTAAAAITALTGAQTAGRYLRSDGTNAALAAIAAADLPAATGAAVGVVQLANDLGGTATAPTVVSTHLAAPLPIAQGGTGSATQVWVDLTTGQSIAGVKTFTGEVVVPTPVNPSDAVTKTYADAIAQGLSIKASVQEATAAALPANTYANGSSGVGATLTANANAALTVDGIAVAANDRVLVQNEATASHNGIYTVTATGSAGAPYVLTRAADMNTASQIPGAFTFVESGTVNAGAGFVVASVGPFTIGTTSIAFTQFSGAGEITAGTGLTKTGNTLALTTPVAQANLPSATGAALGIVQLAGDLGGTASSPTVVGTHLAAPLPIAQGGTGSATQNWVDLSTGQTAAGAKTWSGAATFNAAVSITNSQLSVTGNSDATAVAITYSADNPTGAAINYIGQASASNLVLSSKAASADTVGRFVFYADGTHWWGSGSATRDTNLYRGSAGVVKTDHSLDVVTHALGGWTARESGLVAATCKPTLATSTLNVVNGTIYLVDLFVNRAASVTKFCWGIKTAGASATANQNWVALVDPTGTVLASVNVDARVATTGEFEETITSQNLTPGFYRGAFLFNATTPPGVVGNAAASAAMANCGIASASNYIVATNGTAQTAMPASFTLSSNVASSFGLFAAIK